MQLADNGVFLKGEATINRRRGSLRTASRQRLATPSDPAGQPYTLVARLVIVC